ncbi:MAG TPA: GlsB/YeaQ/YmgE family stress response membrane protein [Pirellulaceae bacterium]
MGDELQTISTISQFSGPLEVWVNDVLVWIGFGTLVGLLARAIMPGRDPGGAIATLGMGIGGVVIGCGAWSLFSGGQRITPVSPVGMLVAIAGAFTLLFFYRLLGGYWFDEAGDEVAAQQFRGRTRTRPRRYRRVLVDE